MGTVLFGATVSMKLGIARPAPKRTVPIGAAFRLDHSFFNILAISSGMGEEISSLSPVIG